jgi:rhodanese-related sulfurtransferase
MRLIRHFATVAFALMITCSLLAQSAERIPASTIPSAYLIQPEDLAKQIEDKRSEKPLILQVGSHVMYAQAHIPAAEYAGPAGKEDGHQALRERISNLPKSTKIILYCGCCPWRRCPNIAPAYRLLHEQGFTSMKVLYIAEDFGTNWVAKGYPTDKGQ